MKLNTKVKLNIIFSDDFLLKLLLKQSMIVVQNSKLDWKSDCFCNNDHG